MENVSGMLKAFCVLLDANKETFFLRACQNNRKNTAKVFACDIKLVLVQMSI